MERGPINEGDSASAAVPVMGGDVPPFDNLGAIRWAGQGHNRHALGHPYGPAAKIDDFDHADYHHEEK